MKKLLIAMIALVLVALTALPALADRPYDGPLPLARIPRPSRS